MSKSKSVFLIVEGCEEYQKATDQLKLAIAKALGISLAGLDFRMIFEDERPSTNAAMWKLVEEIGAIGVTDLTLPIYTRLTREGKFFILNPESGEVEQVTALKVETDKTNSPD